VTTANKAGRCREYVDHESGGTSSARTSADVRRRPPRQFDLVMFWSLDRFSRRACPRPKPLERPTGYGVTGEAFTENTGLLRTVRDAVLSIWPTIAEAERVRPIGARLGAISNSGARGRRNTRTAAVSSWIGQRSQGLPPTDCLSAQSRRVGHQPRHGTSGDARGRYRP